MSSIILIQLQKLFFMDDFAIALGTVAVAPCDAEVRSCKWVGAGGITLPTGQVWGGCPKKIVKFWNSKDAFPVTLRINSTLEKIAHFSPNLQKKVEKSPLS